MLIRSRAAGGPRRTSPAWERHCGKAGNAEATDASPARITLPILMALLRESNLLKVYYNSF